VAGLFDLSGRVVVVTGGLGQLGRHFSAELVRHGARVAVLDRVVPSDFDAGLGGLLDRPFHDRVMPVQADVTSRASLADALSAVTNRWETPFGLVNNAAIDSPPDASAADNGPFEELDEAGFQRVMDVNVKGVVLASQVFGGAMAKAGRGSIANIGSIYGVLSPDQNLYEYRRERGETFFKPATYSISKSALYNLTRYLAVYWAKQQVRVNILTLAGVFNNQDPAFLKGYLPKVPLGRMASPGDYTGAMVYLMSDASAYMSGSTLTIDGGFTAI
jgi:NAD(P)-dependent dehydrogenase (short-subunit alcohol dehydrogenase family)